MTLPAPDRSVHVEPPPRWPPPAPPKARGPNGALVAVGVVVAALVAAAAVVVVSRDDGEAGETADAGGGWTVEGVGTSYEIVVAGGAVCTTSAHAMLTCFDATTGDGRFRTDIGDIPGSVAVAGETLVVTSSTSSGATTSAQGGLAAYTLDGTGVWTATGVGDPQPGERPAISGDVVAGLTQAGLAPSLVGLDVASGEELWRMDPADDALLQPPVSSDGARFYVRAMGPESTDILAIDPASGTELWRATLAASPAFGGVQVVDQPVPLDDGGSIAIPTVDNTETARLTVLDTATGARRWQVDLTSSSPTIAQLDALTVVADGADLRAYDPDGAVVWEAPEPNIEQHPGLAPYAGNLVVAGDALYDVSRDVYEIDLETGAATQVVAEADADHVAVADDRLFVGGTMGFAAVPLDDVPSGRSTDVRSGRPG